MVGPRIPDKPYFRPDEVATIFGVSIRTVRRWIILGRVESVKVTERTIRVPRSSLVRVCVQK